MEMLEKNTENMQNPKVAVPHSEIILNELRTLSLHAKLVLCASIHLFSKDKYIKVTPTDVFTEYKKLAAKYNVKWLSAGKVTEHIKELEMLGFLKCTIHAGVRGFKLGMFSSLSLMRFRDMPKYCGRILG